MLNLNEISIIILACILIFLAIGALIDSRHKRQIKNYPKISFLVPCYNDGETIGDTIKSIYSSYDSNKLELIVINDNSSDDSLAQIKKIAEKYPLRIINNEVNLGKAKSLNLAYKKTKYDLLWVVDSDLILNKKALDDVLARLQSDENIGAVSCPYRLIGKGTFIRMQEMEYNMMSLLLRAYNRFSAMALWGGCLAVRKKEFERAGLFSENMLTEDIDLAFKLKEKGIKVEHASFPVFTHGVENFKDWFKQKQRWVGGGTQCYLAHIKVWIRHPLQVVFFTLYSFLSIVFFFYLIKEIIFINSLFQTIEPSGFSMIDFFSVVLASFSVLSNWLLSRLFFSVFSIPYILPNISSIKDSSKLFLIFPYAILYWPIFSLFAVVWVIKGVCLYFRLYNGKRAW